LVEEVPDWPGFYRSIGPTPVGNLSGLA